MCKILTLVTDLTEDKMLKLIDEYDIGLQYHIIYPNQEGSNLTYVIKIEGINDHCLCTMTIRDKLDLCNFILKLTDSSFQI